MRTLEVRRHSWTRKGRQEGDPHLSPAGVRWSWDAPYARYATVDGNSFVDLELRRLASIRA